MKNVWMSWSTGKDSAFALASLLKNPKINVSGLVTTVTETFNRVSMHSTREALLDEQAKRLNLPLYKVKIPSPCTNEIYESKMKALIEEAVEAEVDAMAFGDLFLEDVRDYRIKQLSKTSIEPLFPIWGSDTHKLAKLMINRGYKAIITCIDEKKLEPQFAGREFNRELLDSLPPEVDPCGENGEFHSFVYGCPLFATDIPVTVGESVSRDGFTFCDLS